MRRAVTAVEMQELDRWAIEMIGIPAICLMENAGRIVAEEVQRILRSGERRIVVVCGTGNNGGDGFVAARHLFNNGFRVSVLLVGKRSGLSDEALVNYVAAGNLKIPIHGLDGRGRAAIRRAHLIIDALFGIGLSRPVEGEFGQVIEAMNASRAKKVSVDIPSGLDATTGEIWGICVRADMTVTLAHPKKGLFKKEGPRYAGRIRVVDIGIPKKDVK